MDKQIAAITSYDVGWRAYIDFDGVKFFSNINTPRELEAKTFAGQHPESIEHWRYLRAYQDAERKKGVPIRYNQVGWRPSYTVGDFKFYFRDMGPHDPHFGPYIEVENVRNPERPYRVAKFTNFRWRAGYPKGGQNG